MKITVTLKDPDTFHDSVSEAVESDVADIDGLNEDERAAIADMRKEAAWESLAKFVEHQEYVTIVFDTDAGTATVEKRK